MIYSRSPGWETPQEQKNVSPAPYPWRKLYSCKNKTFLGPTFPFPWSSGLSSLAALGRQLSCRSRKVKSSPATSFVLTRIHSFRGKERGIYIPPRVAKPREEEKNFPMNHERHIIYGGAGVVKINFPMSGEAANEEIYFHYDCCAICYVPWVMNGEICPSLFLHIKGFTFPYKEWKLPQEFYWKWKS